MAQPKIGTTGLKGTPQQILLGAAHTSGVRLEEEPRLLRDARPLKTHFRFLSTTFCPATQFFSNSVSVRHQSGAKATAVQTLRVIGKSPGNRASVWTAAVDHRSRPPTA
jgi:hypothetical protein